MHLGKTPVYLVQPLFQNTRKIEDLSPSADGKWNFATTGFDRHRPDKAAWDAFNRLLYWPVGAPDQVAVSNAETREGVTSSVGLRASIQGAMANSDDKGPPYFKIEGLAALPNNRLLFGVRERGASFKDFDYTVTLLEVGYAVDEDGRISLKDNMTEAFRFQPNKAVSKGHGPFQFALRRCERTFTHLDQLRVRRNPPRHWVFPVAVAPARRFDRGSTAGLQGGRRSSFGHPS